MTGYVIKLDGKAFSPDSKVEMTEQQIAAHNTAARKPLALQSLATASILARR